MHTQNGGPILRGGQSKEDLAVKTAWPPQCRVNCVGPAGAIIVIWLLHQRDNGDSQPKKTWDRLVAPITMTAPRSATPSMSARSVETTLA